MSESVMDEHTGELIRELHDLVQIEAVLRNPPDLGEFVALYFSTRQLEALVEAINGPTPVLARVEVFRSAEGDHYWRAIARNGLIVADSAEGYRNRSDCTDMATRLFPGVTIEQLEGEG